MPSEFEPFEPRRPTSRRSLRIAVLGGVAVALFAVLFFRLWNLQILDGGKYLAQAQNNRTREYKVLAPRGDILDREGNVLVDNRTSLALLLRTEKLPEDPVEEVAELERIGELAHMKLKRMRATIKEQEEVAAGAPVTLRHDVGYDLVYYLEENARKYPGLSVEQVFVRRYPKGVEAAHVLGTVGEVSEEELKDEPHSGLEAGENVGKGGLEKEYNDFLRGKPGVTRIQVNALGQPTPGGELESEAPTPGDNLVLALDPKVQEAGEAALSEQGLPGAFVTMDIHNGQILGMGSRPTFEPSVFTHPLSQAKYDEEFSNPEVAPLTNRATAGTYPTGSIYKVITALAALEGGFVTPGTTIDDNGSIELAGQKFQNAGGASYGPLTMVPALQVSSDVFFYELGRKMNQTNQLQKWSRALGVGDPTGLDLPEEPESLVPSKAWRDQLYREGETERPWSVGDNIQLATGQGDLLTDPMQMAIAYAALGNGGTIVTPHLGLELEDPAGRVLREFAPKAKRHVKINPGYREVILQGLHEAAQTPGGTSYEIFGGFPVPVAGKTGTAQRPPHADQAWYAVLAPYPNPRIVTIVTFEEGGFGAETAAPAALQILESYFNKQATAVSGANGGSPG
jgi:penicillin-binding protein 2